jgi:hypothetical protein
MLVCDEESRIGVKKILVDVAVVSAKESKWDEFLLSLLSIRK